MKSFQDVRQVLRRQIADEPVEETKGITYFFRIAPVPDRVEGLRCRDETECPPAPTIRVKLELLPFLGRKQAQDLPTAPGRETYAVDTPEDVLGDGVHVLHHQLRPTKNVGVQALQDERSLIPPAPKHQKRFMNVAAAMGLNIGHPARRGEPFGNLQKLFRDLRC